MNWDPIISVLRILSVPIFLFLSLFVYLTGQVWGQKSSRARMELVDPKDHQGRFDTVAQHHEWAEARGFEWLGAYVFIAPFNPQVFITCWRRASDGVVAACYAMGGKQIFDFVTVYDDDGGLTTCTSSGAMLYPTAPGVCKQAFTTGGLDFALQRHTEGDQFLRDKFMLRKARPEPIEQLFVRGIAKTARRVWKIWFFQVRSLYWYSRLNKKANVPVSRQKILAPR